MNKPNNAKAAPTRERAARVKRQTKGDKVIALLRRDNGASLDDIVKATGWQKHSVRGFMAGALKKRHGLTATSDQTETGLVYRVAAVPRT